MLADIFYLSATWLIISLVLVLLLGVQQKFRSFIWSVLYLAVVTGLGDIIGLLLLGEPAWLIIVGSAAILLSGLPIIYLLRNWNAPGQVFFLFSLTTGVLYLLYAFAVTAFSSVSIFAFIFSFILLFLETASLGISITYAFEVLDVLCRVRWHRRPTAKPLGAYAPMVSLHVPAYNEPPELVEKTLRALAKLNYPNYEIILIDNNTPSEDVWQPLAKVCQELNFKCLHLDKWPGYKSGALNFGLTMTDPRAEIIGVIDADYLVEPDYLRRIVPYFEDPRIAFVQTPQDYREFPGSRFFQAAYDGYKYFFALSMPSRNERNAIIFCGTMGLLRKKVLQEIGGWDEWCITEDAETSLRMLNRGYESLYVAETFGRGLMPMDFEGLKKQRFRWAFGGVQILKKHWDKLMPWSHWIDPANRLSASQRYFYLMSGLQWFNELLTFFFTIMVLISVGLTLTGHTSFLRPTTQAFIVLPIVILGTNFLRAIWGLRHALGVSWKRSIYALTLWFGLTWVSALACVQAVVQKKGVFLRTPKAVANAAWARALQVTSWETILGATCIVGGLAVLILAPSALTMGLLVLCVSQAFIYLAAPSHSLLSLETVRGIHQAEPDRASLGGRVANESRLGLQLGLAAVAISIVVLVASLLPARTTTPSWYAVVNPQHLITPQAEPPIELPAILPIEGPADIPAEDGSPTEPGTPTESATPAGSPTAGESPTAGASPTTGSSPTGESSITPTGPAATGSPPAESETPTPAEATTAPTEPAATDTPPAPTPTAPAASPTP